MDTHRIFRRIGSAIGLALLAGAAFLAGSCKPAVQSQLVYQPTDFRLLSALGVGDFEHAVKNLRPEDHIGAFFRDPLTKENVLSFFEAVGASRAVSIAILDAAERYKIPAGLAMALVHEESGFKVRAVNRNSDSTDRGLFQLNSLSFPKLTMEDFFDPETNARNGAAHLAYCLEQGGNEVAALAMYNAGYGRVSKGGTPRRTLDYIFRIISYRANLEALFEAQVVARAGGQVAMAARDASLPSSR